MELRDILPLLACPDCGGELRDGQEPPAIGLSCAGCGAAFPVRDGVPLLHPTADRSAAEAGDAFWFREDSRESIERRHATVRRLARFPNPAISNDDALVALRRVYREQVLDGTGLVLNLGSGQEKRLGNPYVLNFDISPHDNTDVVGDGLHLPFRDDVFDGVVLDSVLEHVPDPWRLVDHLYRALRPGGFVIVHAPFMYPYHGAPHDYFRYTDRGLAEVFSKFEIVELGTDRLPGRAMQELVRVYASIYSDRRAVAFGLRWLAAWLALPYKLFDHYLKRKQKAHLIVAGFSLLARKPHA